MKIAVVSDIHGNVLALEAVLEDIKAETPDIIVNLGDCVSGPLWPEETAAILRENNWPTVMGNHDRFLIDRPIGKMAPTDAFAAERLSPESLSWIETLQPTIRLGEEIFLCHGTPDNDDRYLTEKVVGPKGHLPDEETLLADLKGEKAPIVCCGHTHIPRVIHLQATGQTILNPGSVGLPSYEDDHPRRHKMETGSPHARYALMTKTGTTWNFQEKILTYDWDAAAAEAQKNGRKAWARSLKHGFFGPLS
ncbi:MAG: metallophosphoesterase family protein [Roseibium sp.]|uniref:metallophosphoesterase family protein n=1 Tax=Roseibium sp. TaxID=1936156 RepID=UPI001B1DAFD8|nr:metallophosphoesterase family protein [Roseibium sp.]MBO6895568.1 metallophosphoesterase family protein [Roseibium sp.]MBO6929383.1 metallophosphoesterase family protein [Roseibium sp.]